MYSTCMRTSVKHNSFGCKQHVHVYTMYIYIHMNMYRGVCGSHTGVECGLEFLNGPSTAIDPVQTLLIQTYMYMWVCVCCKSNIHMYSTCVHVHVHVHSIILRWGMAIMANIKGTLDYASSGAHDGLAIHVTILLQHRAHACIQKIACTCNIPCMF